MTDSIYNYSTNSGFVTIEDTDGGNDKIVITSSVYNAGNVKLVRDGLYDLYLRYNNTNLMLIKNQFTENGALEKIEFSNGSSINLSTYSHIINDNEGGNTIYGTDAGAGGDRLNGNGGYDSIFGYRGDDTISGGNEGDYIDGGDGNDRLRGDAGDDTVIGGLGNDVFMYDSGLDSFVEMGGNDTVEIKNPIYTLASVTLHRQAGNQTDLEVNLNGVHAFTLYNQFTENLGFEKIKLANGNTLDLTRVIYNAEGTEDSETLYGTGFGGNPNNVINGYGGSDSLYGYEGNDTLNGGNDYDTLYGGSGNDLMNGGSGTDYMYGETGNDTYLFESGFEGAASGLDYVYENINEGGADIVKFTSLNSTDVFTWSDGSGYFIQSISNPDQTVQIYGSIQTAGTDVGQRVEKITFANNVSYYLYSGLIMNDTGDSHALYGNGGTDNIIGNGGIDTLYGYAGNDRLEGGSDYDYLYGGLGNDTYMFNAGFGSSSSYDYLQEELNEGTADIAKFTSLNSTDVNTWSDGSGFWVQSKLNPDEKVMIYGVTGTEGSDVGQRLEQIRFLNGVTLNLAVGLVTDDTDDSRAQYGSSLGDNLNGNGGNDALYGYVGNDALNGGNNDDALYGGAGNDTLEGGEGYDYMYGGVDNDTYVFGTGFGSVSSYDYVQEELSQGTDAVNFTVLNSTDVYTWADGSGFWVQNKSDSSETLLVYGTVQSDGQDVGQRVESASFADAVTLNLAAGIVTNDSDDSHSQYGSSLGDNLNGNGGNDAFYGYGGNDTLNGGNNDDTLYGDAGNDTLEGGEGYDYMYGGVDNDTYVFGAGFGSASSYDYVQENVAEGTDKAVFTTLNIADAYIWGDSSGLWVQNKADANDRVLFYGTLQSDGLDVGQRVENLKFADGNRILTSGLTMNDSDEAHSLYGSSNADNIDGNGGGDSIYGYDGADTINGGADSDSLYGDAGADTLEGGDGYDYLYGGADADTFLFLSATAFGTDNYIGDFSIVEDNINIADLLSGYDPLTSAIADFVDITTDGSNSFLTVDSDGGGDSFVQIAFINNVTGLDEQTMVNNGNLIVA
jgi:Ca2+-binding RTX toxin-like protein